MPSKPEATPEPEGDAAAIEAPRLSARDIARDLRRQIQGGQLGPGVWLREVALAQKMNTGRSAVREALRMLQADGLVEIERFRGARVTVPTHYEMFDLFEVRAALFGLIARFTCFRASDADLREIVERIERFVASVHETSVEERHNEGVEIATMMGRHASRDARDMMAASHRKARWHFSYLDLSDRQYRPIDDWRDLGEKLSVRNVEGAANAARRIVYFGQQEVIKALAARGAPTG